MCKANKIPVSVTENFEAEQEWMSEQDARVIPVAGEVFDAVMNSEHAEESLIPVGVQMLQERFASEEDFVAARDLFVSMIENA